MSDLLEIAPEPRPMRRVLILADHVPGAARIWSSIRRVPGREVRILICGHGQGRRTRFAASQVYQIFRSLRTYGLATLSRVLRSTTFPPARSPRSSRAPMD